jgi:hypothetical protein
MFADYEKILAFFTKLSYNLSCGGGVMFLKKAKRKVCLKENSEISKICETCMFASPLHAVEELMCKKKGLVSPGFTCKHYSLNHLIKHPRKRRKINTAHLTIEDFEI